jgi:hypothetical protein
VLVAALAIVVGVVVLLSARDDATTNAPAAVPGRAVDAAAQGSAADRRLLALGDVVLRAGPAELVAARGLARDVAGPAEAATVDAGQAVLVRAASAPGVRAEATGRELHVASASDPALRAFIDHWLGRGSGP